MNRTRRNLNLACLFASSTALLSVAGCAAPTRLVDLPPMPPVPPGQSRIVMMYPSEWSFPNSTWTAQVDGRPMGDLNMGEYALIPVPPHSHKIVMAKKSGPLAAQRSVDVDLDPGRTAYFMFLRTSRGTSLFPLPEDIAARHLREMREVHL